MYIYYVLLLQYVSKMIDDNNIVNICFGGTFCHNITQHQDTIQYVVTYSNINIVIVIKTRCWNSNTFNYYASCSWQELIIILEKGVYKIIKKIRENNLTVKYNNRKYLV